MTEQGPEVVGARNPREPNVHSGGEQEPGGGDRPLPPYDDLPGQPGRQTTGKSQHQLEQERGGTGKSDVGPRQVSQEERDGVGDADLAPQGPHGVGQSTSTSGEDLMRGKSEDTRREERLDGGIADTTRSADPDMPDVRTGDQGG